MNFLVVNLIGSELSGGELSGSEFFGDELSGDELSGSEFSGGELSGVQMSSGELSSGESSGSKFSGREFCGVQMPSGELPGSEFWGGELSGVEVSCSEQSGGESSILVPSCPRELPIVLFFPLPTFFTSIESLWSVWSQLLINFSQLEFSSGISQGRSNGTFGGSLRWTCCIFHTFFVRSSSFRLSPRRSQIDLCLHVKPITFCKQRRTPWPVLILQVPPFPRLFLLVLFVQSVSSLSSLQTTDRGYRARRVKRRIN